MDARSFRPDIQGLRALAVLAVLGYHAGIAGFGGGYLGVDVFFVISGFLIGGHLLHALRVTGRIHVWGFFARRARRILPASLTVIVLTVLAGLVLGPPVRNAGLATDAVWAALSAANLRFAVVGTDYLAGATPSLLQHYWSLGVEEQFYLLAPVALIGLFAVSRRARPLRLVLGAVVVLGSFVLCLACGQDSPWTYFGLPARAWELGIGVLAAAASTRLADAGRASARALTWAGGALLVVAAVAGSVHGFPHPGAGTAVPVLGTAALLIGGASQAGAAAPVSRLLAVRPARAIGTLSFSLYLVHWPILALAQERAPGAVELPFGVTVLLVAAAFPAAWLLWRLIERPFLSGTVSAAPARRSVFTGAAAIAALSAALLVATPAIAAAPLSSGRTATDGATVLPAGTAYVPSNMHPTLAGAADDTGRLYTDGCQQNPTSSRLIVCRFGPAGAPVLVLFGDSHAGRWFPALQSALRDEDVQLVTLTKSGCRSIETEELWAGAPNRSCAEWRAAAIDWIAANHPRLVILADHLGRSDGPAERIEARWRDATRSTLARFPADVPVAIIAETPEFAFSPPVCLSMHLTDAGACGAARADALNAPVIAAVREAGEAAGAAFFDLNNRFCNESTCPAVIGRTLVYTDEHHVSATFSAQLGPALRVALEPWVSGPSSAASSPRAR